MSSTAAYSDLDDQLASPRSRWGKSMASLFVEEDDEFSQGNSFGRTPRRRWQFLPVENRIHTNQQAYYEAINASTEQSNSAPFIDFMLGEILTALEKHKGGTTPNRRRRIYRKGYRKKPLTSCIWLEKIRLFPRQKWRDNLASPVKPSPKPFYSLCTINSLCFTKKERFFKNTKTAQFFAKN